MTEVPKIVHDRLRAARAGQSSPGQNSAEARHPDADLLTAFAEQALSPTERDGVLEHLALCGDCREVVAVALPALDVVAAAFAAETDATRFMPIAVKAGRSWLSSPMFSWVNLRWATVAAAVAVVASVLLLRPGKLNQPTLPSVTTQATTAEPPASGTQVASSTTVSSTADQVTALAKTGEVRSAPEMRTGVRQEMQSSKKPDARRVAAPPQQTDSGMFLADNRLSDEKKDALRTDKPSSASMPMTGATTANSPVGRGATETVEVSAAAPAVSTTSSPESNLMARAEAPAIEKAKPALKEMDTNTNEAIIAEAQTTDAAVSGSAAKSQAQDSLYARKTALSASTASSPNVTWAVTAGAVQRSLDSGRSWQSVLRADHPLRCYASHDQNVWAGGLSGTLFHSADGGLTWARVHPSVKDLALTSDITHIDLLGSGEVVVSTSKNEVWNSADGGQTWEKK